MNWRKGEIVVAGNFQASGREAVVDRVRSILSGSKVSAIRKLGVTESDTGVVLTGDVSLYYYKQLAQELVRSQFEELAIVNKIHVVDPK